MGGECPRLMAAYEYQKAGKEMFYESNQAGPCQGGGDTKEPYVTSMLLRVIGWTPVPSERGWAARASVFSLMDIISKHC